MIQSTKQIKQRYFQRVYEEAPLVPCACGCGELMKNKDKYGRDKKFINGHNSRKYDDPGQHKREWNHRNRQQRFAYKTRRVHQIKADLISASGGGCTECGLEFDGNCVSLFEFHHKDPSTKLFSLSYAGLSNNSKAKVQEEVKKCVLLCANCHRLLHWYEDSTNMADSY